uniref:NAD(P)-binding domain-containing protein n=1 Tax=viral metagenome TaxID=1070528 RepID=A0A6C0I1X4_9ZZZZ
MKILIYGHAGWIGSQFVELLQKEKEKYTNDAIDFVLGNSRVDDTPELCKELDEVAPSHVISFIGRTHGTIGTTKYTTIDYLEQPGKLVENVKDNLFSPISLALACKERNIHYTYLGTGCIFSYKNMEAIINPNLDQNHLDKGFNEDDIPNFFGSGYSIVKGFTDRLMHQLSGNVLNLRIRMPIVASECPRNFITKIVNYSKVCSVPNSMSVLDELLPIVIKMIKSRLVGTINLTNPGVISHNEILEMYQKHVDPQFTWNNFSVEEQRKILACDRSNNYLDTTALEKFAPEVRCIKDAIEDTIKNYKRADKNENNMHAYAPHTQTDAPTHFEDSNETILFVTGGAGFIGSHFINNIFSKYENIKIINFDTLYYCANENNVNELVRQCVERYTFIKGNLQSSDLLNYIFQTNKITHIVHFAAQSHVQTSFTDAIAYTNDNILGTHNLLEAARLYCKTLKLFIHVSTDEVYGENESADIKTEKSILCPTNPYAATKASAELLAQSYNHSFKIPIIITRGNNVYGPNQYPEKVIPRFIHQLKSGSKVTIQNGNCMRAFLHVYDTATAFIAILEKGKIGKIYNIGCDEGMEYSILEVAKILIRKIINVDDDNTSIDFNDYIEYIEDRPFNDKRYYISNDKLKKLGWNITVDFETGINGLLMG